MFTAKSECERNLKISQHLAKSWTRVGFLTHGVLSILYYWNNFPTAPKRESFQHCWCQNFSQTIILCSPRRLTNSVKASMDSAHDPKAARLLKTSTLYRPSNYLLHIRAARDINLSPSLPAPDKKFFPSLLVQMSVPHLTNTYQWFIPDYWNWSIVLHFHGNGNQQSCEQFSFGHSMHSDSRIYFTSCRSAMTPVSILAGFRQGSRHSWPKADLYRKQCHHPLSLLFEEWSGWVISEAGYIVKPNSGAG